MAASHVLGLSASDYAATQKSYPARVEDDRIKNHNKDQLDAFAGHLTASFVDTFYVSGTLAGHLGQGSDVGGEFYGGLRVNLDSPRHLKKVVCFSRMTGSGGVTVVDVQKIATGSIPTSNESIFSNLVYKCILSASEGFAVGESSTFAAGSSSWAAGEFLGVVLDSVTDGPSADLTVQIHWMPSASYG